MAARSSDASAEEPESELERIVDREIEQGLSPKQPLRQQMRKLRNWARQHPQFRRVYLGIVATVGVAVTVVGLALVPLPGPGWLIVFLGLAILGTEFHWARRLTAWAKRKIERFWRWWNSRKAKRES